MDSKIETTQQPLLVTTLHKGVFFGYGKASDASTIILKNARMCVYWSENMHGVMGLAAKGPDTECRIGPSVSEITIRDVTAVIVVSDEAKFKWEKEPWN